MHLDGVRSPVPPRWGRSQAQPPEEEEGGTKQNSHGRGGQAGPESGDGRSQRDALSLPDAWPQPQPRSAVSPATVGAGSRRRCSLLHLTSHFGFRVKPATGRSRPSELLPFAVSSSALLLCSLFLSCHINFL